MDLRGDDILFGKIALNKRLIHRDLLNRALQYQRTQAPDRPLGEILLEKGILSREQVDEILAFQNRVKQIKQTSSPSQQLNINQLQSQSQPFPSPSQQLPGGASQPQVSAQGQPQTGSWRGSPGAPSPRPASPPPGGAQQPQPQSQAAVLGSTPDPEQDEFIGAVVGGCVINAKIGAGGMGSIYLARHESLRKDVVVKILPAESAANPRTVERFFREARAAAKLEHPNIVQVQDVGTTDGGLHYIIMQYVDGKNLEQTIQERGRFTPPDAAKLILQIAQGLKVAHAGGVIHRDIKAENVLVTTAGIAKLTDFGLAKDLNSELKLTADGAMIGTPLYMAPEIGRVKEIDGRVDIYSLGVTLYYLITGIQPFRGFSALEILSAKAHDKLKAPELYAPDMPDEHRRVMGKMLEKDRDHRYLDVDGLIRDLEALDRGFPIDAGEPSIWPARGEASAGGGADPSGQESGKASGRIRGKGGTGRPAAGQEEHSTAIVALVGVVVLAIVILLIVLVWLLFFSS